MPKLFAALQKLTRRPKQALHEDPISTTNHKSDEASLNIDFRYPDLANHAYSGSTADVSPLPAAASSGRPYLHYRSIIEDSELERAYQAFIVSYPQYLATDHLDHVRRVSYSRLDQGGHVYLDYIGASLYPSHLIDWHHNLLSNGVFGNPHSESPTSQSSTFQEHAARRAVLDFVDADPEVYEVIFTANASGALGIITDNYSFEGKRLVMALDAHNSVNGMACVAREAGGVVDLIELDQLYSTVDTKQVQVSNPRSAFFTGQSNITSAKFQSSWLTYARQNGWHTGIDASALAPSTLISLRFHPLDFLVISIYKIIGYPTGVGALIIRKDVRRSVLSRHTFAGGTIDAVRPEDGSFRLSDSHAAHEDGTVNFLALPAVVKGLEFVKPLIPLISERCGILIKYLWKELSDIRYDDRYDTPLIEIRGPPPGPDRGSTLALLFRQPSDTHDVLLAPFKFIVWAAAKRNISVRGGPCLCNPGAASSVLRGIGFEDWEKTVFSESGIIRISLGIASNFADSYKFVRFCKDLANVSVYQAEFSAWKESTKISHAY